MFLLLLGLFLWTLITIVSFLLTREAFHRSHIFTLTGNYFLPSIPHPPNEAKVLKRAQLLTCIDTQDKRFPWCKNSIQCNGHQLLIFNLHPHGNQLISRLSELHQVTNHVICATRVDGRELVSHVHLARNVHTLVQSYQSIIHLLSHLLIYHMRDHIVCHQVKYSLCFGLFLLITSQLSKISIFIRFL